MSPQTLLLIFCRVLERAGFYGVRGVLVLYMVNGILQLGEQKSVEIYGYLMLAFTLSYLPGALLGDLLLGSRKAMIIGAAAMALGAFALCIPAMQSLYVGLALLSIGLGLFDCNFLAQFGKYHLDQKQSLDAQFAFLYALVNIAAFAGGFLISTLVGYGSFILGFVCAGTLLLASAILAFFVKPQEAAVVEDFKKAKAFLIVGGSIFIVSLYWIIYEFATESFYPMQEKLLGSYPELTGLVGSGSVVVLIPLCLVFGLIWMFKSYSPWIKLAIGFLFGALAFLFLSGQSGSPQFSLLDYFLVMLMLALSELHIQPIMYSIITRYAHPKYLAIVTALSMVPSKILGYFYPIYLLHDAGRETAELMGSGIVLSLIGLFVGTAFFLKKNTLSSH
ncbi:MFS transporter [Flavobacterium sp.]|uniref:MFS transporter n=1 Tax=Flavobacterium sp. TaxID=239 RepID=UPI0039E2A3D5